MIIFMFGIREVRRDYALVKFVLQIRSLCGGMYRTIRDWLGCGRRIW